MITVFASLSLSSALVGGVFLTFSDFVMPSLRQTDGSAGIAAMQQINRRVYRTIFMVLLLGLAPVSLGLAVWAWAWSPALAAPLGAAAASWSLLVIGVTVVGNVPMNERLAAMPTHAPETTLYWARYVDGWSTWNHLRVIGSILTAAAYGTAALEMAAG